MKIRSFVYCVINANYFPLVGSQSVEVIYKKKKKYYYYYVLPDLNNQWRTLYIYNIIHRVHIIITIIYQSI